MTKSILMTAIIMIGAPVGIFIAALIIDRFHTRRLFGSSLLIIIALLGCTSIRFKPQSGPS